MPSGPERMVLSACDELTGQGYGFVLDSDIAERTGLGFGMVQDCLLGLEREGLVDLVRLESHNFKASLTPTGRQERVKDGPGTGTRPPAPGGKRPMPIVPKGLRSFDEHDADFFLELLPGPRRADGLPESIHF